MLYLKIQKIKSIKTTKLSKIIYYARSFILFLVICKFLEFINK